MKKMQSLNFIVWGIGLFFAVEASACIGSDCKPCPDGYSIARKCCSATDKSDCIFLDNEIEDCGKGKWQEYPHSFPITSRECCKDASENNCRTIPFREYCGSGVFREYPYSPVKNCCKDTAQNDCVTIRSKKKCGKYQLEKYPVTESDCCNPDLKECTGQVRDCPKCL